jgi:hypothetical protein
MINQEGAGTRRSDRMKDIESVADEPAGLGLVSGRHVRLSGESARVGAPCAADGKPHVQVIRDGNLVKAIEVTCGCGQRIYLRCVAVTP